MRKKHLCTSRASDKMPKFLEDKKSVDEILISDITCPCCGSSSVEATCRVHGDQEIAAIRGSKLRCHEWDFSSGKLCNLPLTVLCTECEEEVEV